MLLLNVPKAAALPGAVRRHLETDEAGLAREAFEGRARDPWYSVPDVRTLDFFLTCMSGAGPSLVLNEAGCARTNPVHGVRLRRPGARRPPSISSRRGGRPWWP
jgi:adenine-specific DNA-methyltransferase